MRGSNFYKDAVLFIAMVTVECTNVGLNILFKAANNKGMSCYVFILYSYASTTLVLLPLPFIFRSNWTALPSVKFPLLSRICLLGLLGPLLRILAYTGIAYSSPTLASLISNLNPAFTFILAFIFRMEKIVPRSSSSRAKIIGTVVSISGAMLAVLYKGPIILSSSSPSPSSSSSLLSLGSSQSKWVVGGLLLTTEQLLISICFIIQTQVTRMYPSEFLVVLLYSLCATVISAPLCFIAEPDLSAWIIKPDVALVSIVYSAFFGLTFSTVIHTFGLHIKGPVYTAIFKPLSIFIAAFMSFIFLGDALYLGSVIGAVIICIGFYAVIWGKANEDDSSCTTPLLQSHKVEDAEV